MASTTMSGIYSVLDDERINARADFFTGLGQGVDGSWASLVGTVIPSMSETENYNWLGTVPQLRAWTGEALGKELPNYSHTITNVDYESTLRIQKGDIRRDKTGQIRQRVADLGRRAGTHWESLVSTLINNGQATTGSGAAYDSQAFFDTDHNDNAQGNQTNDLTSTEVPSANVGTATAPTAAEMANIIAETIAYMYGFTDDQGEPALGGMKNFVVMGGSAAVNGAVVQAIGSSLLSSGSTNPLSAFSGGMGVSIQPVFNSRISDTNGVYVFATDGDIGPFILQEEVPLSVAEDDPGPRSKDFYVIASATRAAGYGLWQRAALVTMS